MQDTNKNLQDALQVARMYYDQDLTTQAIADELNLSRSKVSRLLKLAKQNGLVEIRILDPNGEAQQLESDIKNTFNIPGVYVVSVPETAGEQEWLNRVAVAAGTHLNRLMTSGATLGLAWGTTINAISKSLTPKPLTGVQIVQLNGSGNTHNLGASYTSEIMGRFASAYSAQIHPFPVPTLFDYPETKLHLWRERSIQRILTLQKQADILLYSIGAVEAGIPSHVYAGGYLDPTDLQDLEKEHIAGDIATVFFRHDGSYKDVPINARSSGPDLSLFKNAKHALCVVSGKGKARGLLAALRGGYINELIVDEPTAKHLMNLNTRPLDNPHP